LTYPNYLRRHTLFFKDRSQNLTSNDFTYFKIGSNGPNQLTLDTTPNPNVTLKTRQWLMVTDSDPGVYPGMVDFFEIRSVDDSSLNSLILEISPTFISKFTPKSVYLLKDVIRVAYIGG